MSDLNLARGHSPHFSPSRSTAHTGGGGGGSGEAAAQTLHVHLPNHGYRMIKFDEAADVRQIINLIVGSMSHGQKSNPQSYALRLRHILTKEVSDNELNGVFFLLSYNSYIIVVALADFLLFVYYSTHTHDNLRVCFDLDNIEFSGFICIYMVNTDNNDVQIVALFGRKRIFRGCCRFCGCHPIRR